jgi:hypothetical protein
MYLRVRDYGAGVYLRLALTRLVPQPINLLESSQDMDASTIIGSLIGIM